ncbi:UPF0503 protein At3g09070, chloroplastic-like [Durio zibethinus]|uniref:UPF0503 protein At3g09070, chloroplastic-like n=1 Tax=Durio zibethinus TaxID=66656 RepID=A0A6P5ZIG6_DURZI|nr:UPF0503 protein At3g09070, chloroplastic-like [Durio zibethinus]
MTTQPQSNHRQSQRLPTCQRHPTTTPVTSFCASCLRERLAGIQNNSPTATPTPSTFSFRRSKSCSGGPNPSSSSAASELRRKSCDVRAHNTLHYLFAIDDKTLNFNHPPSKVEAFQGFEEEEEEGELKTMKEFIDLEWGSKKTSGRSLWEAASVFSKTLRKWSKKQSKKKEKKEGLVLQKANRRGLRETQSEIGEYGLFGRRSCDTDPRLSVDIGRLSVDDSRFSFDEPRASGDGYLIGKQNSKVNEEGNVGEERLSVVKEEERSCPGGSAQTRDYYADSLTRRRRSFERSASNRKISLGEAEDFKSSISNAKVSPETVELFHGAKLLVTEKELRDSNWYSNVESGSKDVEFVADGVGQKGFHLKKARKWKNVWSILGLIQRQKESLFGEEKRNNGRDVGDGRLAESLQKPRRVANGEEDRGIRGNVDEATLAESLQKLRRLANGDEGKGVGGNAADGTLAESLQKLRRGANGDANGSIVSQKLMRSCSVSSRHSVDGSSFYGMSVPESKGYGDQTSENLMLQHNRSVRHSPNLDNRPSRFYLTPLPSYKNSKSGIRLRNSSSVGGNGA